MNISKLSRTSSALAISTILFSGCAHANTRTATQSLTSPNQCIDLVLNSQDYISALECQQSREAEVVGTPKQNLFDQNTATLLSFVGQEKAARVIFDRTNSYHPTSTPILYAEFEPKAADKAIIEAGKDHQIILINEAHHIPQTRLLTALVLKGLYKKGFRYLAAETFNQESMEDLNKTGIPKYSTGYYSVEPTFANMLREAKRIGFIFVAYEFLPKCDPFFDAPEKCENLREHGQAKNIYERIIAKHPLAKILVHAGYGHIDKVGDGSSKFIPMAKYLWQISGIEPFSVEQTFFIERGKREIEQPFYREIIGRYKIDEPTVLQKKSDHSLYIEERYKDHYDALVILPPLKFENGIATWRKLMPRYEIFKSKNNCNDNEVCVLKAKLKNDPDDAVPEAVLFFNTELQYLWAPKGVYEIQKDVGPKRYTNSN